MDYGSQSMVGELRTVLIKHPRDAFIGQQQLQNQWQTYNYISCPDYKKAEQEYKRFEDSLKEYIPNVFYLPKDDRTGLDSIYTHDAVKITAKGAVLLRPGKILRQGEPAATQSYLEELGIPILGTISGAGRMEGGDVVWLDQKTVAVGHGYRTNEEGIQQFKALVSDVIKEFIVVPLPHGGGPEACLHLMSIISMVDHDLAVVYSEYMPVFFRNLLIERGVKLIDVPKEEYDQLGSNILAIAPRVCLMLAHNPKIKAMLESEGARVMEYAGEEISFKGTGGPTCLTCPVLRR